MKPQNFYLTRGSGQARTEKSPALPMRCVPQAQPIHGPFAGMKPWTKDRALHPTGILRLQAAPLPASQITLSGITNMWFFAEMNG